MLDLCKQKSQQTEQDRDHPYDSRCEKRLDRLFGLSPFFKKFIKSKSKRDQRYTGPDPCHQCSFIGKHCSFKSKICIAQYWMLSCRLCLLHHVFFLGVNLSAVVIKFIFFEPSQLVPERSAWEKSEL